jgi:hypothetical protein
MKDLKNRKNSEIHFRTDCRQRRKCKIFLLAKNCRFSLNNNLVNFLLAHSRDIHPALLTDRDKRPYHLLLYSWLKNKDFRSIWPLILLIERLVFS